MGAKLYYKKNETELDLDPIADYNLPTFYVN